MNPLTPTLSVFGFANAAVGASVAENAPAEEVALNIEHLVFFSNIGVFFVTAWLAWVTYLAVRDSRKHEQASAEIDDRQQKRLADLVAQAMSDAQRNAPGLQGAPTPTPETGKEPEK